MPDQKAAPREDAIKALVTQLVKMYAVGCLGLLPNFFARVSLSAIFMAKNPSRLSGRNPLVCPPPPPPPPAPPPYQNTLMQTNPPPAPARTPSFRPPPPPRHGTYTHTHTHTHTQLDFLSSLPYMSMAEHTWARKLPHTAGNVVGNPVSFKQVQIHCK